MKNNRKEKMRTAEHQNSNKNKIKTTKISRQQMDPLDHDFSYSKDF